jgi:regulation of enolase protein 1 (concanavalin A-like superfamily)
MNTYKITNVTDTAGKRDFKFNSPISIEYVDNMMKKTVIVNPGKSLYLTVADLPLSVHKLRIKNLVSVVEVSQSELESIRNERKPKVAAPVLAEVTVGEEINAEETARKSSRKKKE